MGIVRHWKAGLMECGEIEYGWSTKLELFWNFLLDSEEDERAADFLGVKKQVETWDVKLA